MTFKEVKEFIKKIIEEVKNDPPEGWEFFMIKWPSLTPDEKRLAGPFIMLHCQSQKDDVSDVYGEKFLYITDEKICCVAIYNFIHDELNGKPYFGNLLINPKKAKIVDIAVVFKLLVELEYFKNSEEQVSVIVNRLFGFTGNTTILSYMSDLKKTRIAAKRFKIAANKSKFLNNTSD
jgi:hypothetical protein